MQSVEALIYFELKYCERCGGLWLRPCGAAAIYCAPCGRQMAGIARIWRTLPIAAGAATAALLFSIVQPWMESLAGCLA